MNDSAVGGRMAVQSHGPENSERREDIAEACSGLESDLVKTGDQCEARWRAMSAGEEMGGGAMREPLGRGRRMA